MKKNLSTPTTQNNDLMTLASSLKETNQLLEQMSQRMDEHMKKVNKKVSEIETQIKKSGNTVTPTCQRRKAVPTEVRVSFAVFLCLCFCIINLCVCTIFCSIRSHSYKYFHAELGEATIQKWLFESGILLSHVSSLSFGFWGEKTSWAVTK